MRNGYMAAIEALGEMILQQKNDMTYKDFEINRLKKELEELKVKIKEIETNL